LNKTSAACRSTTWFPYHCSAAVNSRSAFQRPMSNWEDALYDVTFGLNYFNHNNGNVILPSHASRESGMLTYYVVKNRFSGLCSVPLHTLF